jgi:hypothetical protein
MLHQEKSGNPGFSPSVMAYDLRLLLQRWMNFLGVSIENKFCDEEHSPRDQLEYSIWRPSVKCEAKLKAV